MDTQVNQDSSVGSPPLMLGLDDIPDTPAPSTSQDTAAVAAPAQPKTLSLDDVATAQPSTNKSWGDWGKGIAEAGAAGVYHGLAEPMDVYNWVAGKTGLPQTKFSSEQLANYLHTPEGSAERIAAGTGQLGTSIFAPEVGLGAAGAKLAASYGPPAVSAGARALMEAGARPTIAAGLGMAGGAATAQEAAQQFMPASWQGLAQPLAGLAGGIGGAAGLHGAGMVPGAVGMAAEGLGLARPENIPGTDVTATAGQQRRAGAVLAKAAGDNGVGTLNAATNEPGETVPGSIPTLAAQTGLPGISALQHEAETTNPALWQARKEAQDAARTASLRAMTPEEMAGAPPVSAADLPSAIKANVAALGAKGDDTIAPLLEAAQAAAPTAGNAEDVGTGIRSAGLAAQSALKGERAEAYQNASQFGNLLVDAAPLRTAATDLTSNISHLAEQPSGRESAILDAMQKLPRAIPFADLQALDSRVTDAMAEAHNNRSQVSWGRLVQLKSAISDSIHNAGVTPVEPAAIKTAVGETGPLELGEPRLPPLPPRPTGPAPTDLQTFIKWAGGVKDEGGDLRSAGLGSVKGLINPNGMPMDEARRAAGQAGYLGYNLDEAAHNSTVPDFIDRVLDHPAYSVHDDEAVAQREAYQRAVAARAQAKDEAAPSQLNLSQQTERIVAEKGVPWHDAFEEAVGNAQNERIASPALNAGQENEAPGGLGAKSGTQAGTIPTGGGTRGAGVLGIPGGGAEGAGPGTEAAGALAAAKQAHARYAQFKQGPVGQVIKTNQFSSNYAMPAGLAPDAIFPSGNKGFETVNRVKSDLGDAAPQHLENAAALSLLKAAPKRADGTMDPKKVAVWQKNYDSSLRAVPDIAEKFSTAAKASETLDKAIATQKAVTDAYNKGIVGRIMKLDDPEDVTSAIGKVLGSSNSAADVERLANEAARSPGGKEGLKKGVVDSLMQKFTSGSDVISGESFQKFLRSNQSKLGKIFEPDEVNMMNKIADDIAKTQRVATQAKLTGQSTTAPDMLKAIRKEGIKTTSGGGHDGIIAGAGSVLGALVLEHMAPEFMSGHFVGPAMGGAAAYAGVKIAGIGLRRVRGVIGGNVTRNVPELIEEALLNRSGDGSLARALVSKLPKTGDIPALHRAISATSNAILSQGVRR